MSTDIGGSRVTLVIPAKLNMLPVLGAAVREYCAALPQVLAGRLQMLARARISTGRLRLPDSAAVPVSFSHFVYSAELILQEAASNIIRHGYGGEDPQQSLTLALSLNSLYDPRLGGDRFTFQMELSDDAPPFDFTRAIAREPDPLQPRESGYGVFLIRKLADVLDYRYENGRNYLTMGKLIDV
jgi:anti-sigma regulatory factor (Ser/Thr protein kinase)